MHGSSCQAQLSFTDPTFTNQPNSAVDGGVHPSLHPNCYHQIVYCKFNLIIEHPPQYEHLTLDYKCLNENAIAKALD